MSGAESPASGGRTDGVSNVEGAAAAADASDNPNASAGQATAMREAALDVSLPDHLRAVRDRLVEAFGELEVLGFRGELTVVVEPGSVPEVLAFCRDDDDLACELLADLSGVHWPGGVHTEIAQETTGWPSYEVGREEGRIEVDYLLRSIAHGHAFRVRTSVPDERPSLPSVARVYRSAHIMEREVYDFFGVTFEGHPDLRRVLMPEEWVGHPHRKDYPLGGVEVQYKGASVPPPDQRTY